MADQKPKEAAATLAEDSDAERLRADIDRLREDLSTIAGTVREIAETRRAKGEAIARDYADQAYGHARDAVDTLETQVTRNPLMALAAAFGIDWLIGKLMDRS